jgi:hypothetical protein
MGDEHYMEAVSDQGVGGREDTYEFRAVPVPNLWAAVAPYEAPAAGEAQIE